MTPQQILMARFMTALGQYPVIKVDEYNEDREAYAYSSPYQGFIDIALLEQIDEHPLMYVDHILVRAAEAAEKGWDRTSITTGRKYSFGDCSDWYTPIEVDGPSDRHVIHIEVEVG